MNFSIHLPDPLLADLDAYVQTQHTTRSSVIREAVREYLARQALQVWPADLGGRPGRRGLARMKHHADAQAK